MSQATVTVSPPLQTIDDLTVKSRLQLGVTAFNTPDAPNFVQPIDDPGSTPTASWDGGSAVFSGNQVSYGFIFYNGNISGDLFQGNTVDFSIDGDGTAIISGIPDVSGMNLGDMRLWLVRLDSNIGGWKLVLDVTGLTTWTDDGSSVGDWSGASFYYYQYAIGFKSGAQYSPVGSYVAYQGFQNVPRVLNNFAATPTDPAGSRRYVLFYDDYFTGQWFIVADITGVSEYSDTINDINQYLNLQVWTVNNPGSTEYTPDDPMAKRSEAMQASSDASTALSVANSVSSSLSSHTSNTSNPHNVTLAQVGGTNASNLTSGTLANARTTGTAAATANTLMLRDANADTAVRRLSSLEQIAFTFPASGPTAGLTGRADAAQTYDFINFLKSDFNRAFRAGYDGTVDLRTLSIVNNSGTAYASLINTGGNNIGFNIAAGVGFAVQNNGTNAILLGSDGSFSLGGGALQGYFEYSTGAFSAQKLILRNGYTDQVWLEKAGANANLVVNSSSILSLKVDTSSREAHSSTQSWYGFGSANLTFNSTSTTFANALTCSSSIKIGGGTTLLSVYSATATLDFPSIAASSYQDLTISVTGAVVGATVDVGIPATLLADVSYFGWVSAANTVTIRALNNSSTTARDPASGTFRATVLNF